MAIKKIICLIIIIYSLFSIECNTVYAKNTEEVNTKQLFKDLNSMVIEKINYNSTKIIEYSIELINNDPNSLETLCTVSIMQNLVLDSKLNKAINELKKNYIESISNFNTAPAEKTVLLLLIGFYDSNTDSITNTGQFYINTLIDIRNNLQNDKYRALLTLLLFIDKKNGLNYMNEFKQHFINHPFTPFVELNIISSQCENNQYLNCINDSKEWLTKFGDKLSPFGWKLSVECYSLITYCYLALNDLENAKKYYELIKIDAPNYYELKKLKNIIENCEIITE